MLPSPNSLDQFTLRPGRLREVVQLWAIICPRPSLSGPGNAQTAVRSVEPSLLLTRHKKRPRCLRAGQIFECYWFSNPRPRRAARPSMYPKQNPPDHLFNNLHPLEEEKWPPRHHGLHPGPAVSSRHDHPSPPATPALEAELVSLVSPGRLWATATSPPMRLPTVSAPRAVSATTAA